MVQPPLREWAGLYGLSWLARSGQGPPTCPGLRIVYSPWARRYRIPVLAPTSLIVNRIPRKARRECPHQPRKARLVPSSCLRTLSLVPTPHEKAPGIARGRMGQKAPRCVSMGSENVRVRALPCGGSGATGAGQRAGRVAVVMTRTGSPRDLRG